MQMCAYSVINGRHTNVLIYRNFVSNIYFKTFSTGTRKCICYLETDRFVHIQTIASTLKPLSISEGKTFLPQSPYVVGTLPSFGHFLPHFAYSTAALVRWSSFLWMVNNGHTRHWQALYMETDEVEDECTGENEFYALAEENWYQGKSCWILISAVIQNVSDSWLGSTYRKNCLAVTTRNFDSSRNLKYVWNNLKRCLSTIYERDSRFFCHMTTSNNFKWCRFHLMNYFKHIIHIFLNFLRYVQWYDLHIKCQCNSRVILQRIIWTQDLVPFQSLRFNFWSSFIFRARTMKYFLL